MIHTSTPSLAVWPVWRAPAVQCLRQMLGELKGLSITGGEASVRFSCNGVTPGRWLAGFSPEGVSAKRLDHLPDRLGMPAPGAQWFRDHWRTASRVLLGVEQTDTHVVAKVYLERALPLADGRQRPLEHRQASLQIESCKWTVTATPLHQGCRQTEYWRLSGLSGAGMVALLREAAGAPVAVQTAMACVAQVLDRALQSTSLYSPSLLVVRENDSPRHGVCVRFYDSGLRVRDALSFVSTLKNDWAWPDVSWNGLSSTWADMTLGWIQAGQGAHERPSVVMYGALDRAGVRAVLSAAGSNFCEQSKALQES